MSYCKVAEAIAEQKAIARKLARWLPISRSAYEASGLYRSDLPLEKVTEQMSPEDWVELARAVVADAK